MDVSDLTQSSQILAERLEPRLRAGAETFQRLGEKADSNSETLQRMGKTFQAGKYLAAALTPLVLMGFGFGVWAIGLAKKSDVSAQNEASVAAHADLERRQHDLEVLVAALTKSVDAYNAHATKTDEWLLDMRIRLAVQTAAPPPLPAIKRAPR